MGESAHRRATYQDILDAPEHHVAEILEGSLYTHPRPAAPHAEAASVLGMDLGGAFHRGRGGPGGWILLYAPELHLAEDVMVPDLAGWRRERMSAVPPDPFISLAPDWACEVLSPSTVFVDRRRKMPLYAQHGVVHLWLVDPLARLVEVYRLDGRSYRHGVTAGEDDVVRLEPFEAIELELCALWPSIPTEGPGSK